MTAIISPAPGPKRRFPAHILIQFRRDALGYLTTLARRYGDVVTFRAGMQTYFMLSHPDLVKDVFVTREENFTKGPFLQRSKDVLGEGLLTSEGEFHRKQRKLIQPAFHATFVRRYMTDMAACTADLLGRLQDGAMVDVHQEMMQLTLAIAGRTLFGSSLESEVKELSAAMETTISMFKRVIYPWGSLLGKLPLASNRRFAEARGTLRSTIQRMIDERRAEGAAGQTQRGDLLSILLAVRDDETENGMGNEQLFDECFTLLAAGHETTANALTFTWWLLARHSQVLAKLREEVRREESSEKMPYLKAVIAESLRLYPPAWSVGRQAKESFIAGGYEVRKGATVLLAQWVVHRDPRWWPRPDEFYPERWLGEPQHPRYAYFPFGGGVRQCVGDSFALLELGVLLAAMLREVRFEGQSDIALWPTITLRPKREVQMKVVRG